MRTLFNILLVASCALVLSACGNSVQPQATGSTIKAVIKTTALTGDRNITGIQLSITVPPGVAPSTVEITSLSEQKRLLSGATYLPATENSPARVSIAAIVASGFMASDLITIHLSVASGAKPVETDFKLASFEAYSNVDENGNGIDKIFDMNSTDGSNQISLTPSLTTTIH